MPTAGDAGVPDAKTGEHRAWLVAFMASWCGYCAESLPTLRELESRFPELRVVVVTIDETPAGRREEAEKVAAAGLEAPVLRADPATRTTWLGATGSVPRYVFIDSTGRIVAQDRGFGDKVRPMMVDQAMRALRGAPKARPAL